MPIEYTMIPTAREITGNWPARAQACRDNPDRTLQVIDGAKLARLIGEGVEPARAFHRARTALVFLRSTDNMTYAVTIEERDGEGNRVWFGSAGGYGYDRTAAALDGHPIGRGLCATDHCGLDRHATQGTDLEGVRALLVSRVDALPRGLFVV